MHSSALVTSPPTSPPSNSSTPLPTLSSTSPLSAPPTTPPVLPSPFRHPLRATQKLNQTSQIRATKISFLSQIREDWTYPLDPHAPPPKRSSPGIDTKWRERESDSSLCPSPSLEAQGISHDGDGEGERVEGKELDPYRFENPDALGEVKESRSRKRKRAVREELSYNTGLATFIHRRDAWTGAVTMPQSPPSSSSQPASPSTSSNNAPRAFPPLTPKSTTPPFDPPTLLPLPPPLIPNNNPIRAAITPATYPSIYSKIVIQGLAPTIPVNLADVVRAMVDGWKRDGEWPPKNKYEAEEVVGKRDEVVGEEKGRVRRGVRRVGRALGMGHIGHGHGEGEEGDEDI